MALDAAQIVSALRRSDQALHAQLAQPFALGFGAAHCAPAMPTLADANQVRDVLLSDFPMPDAMAAVEAHFATMQRRCLRWTLSSEQPVEPVDAQLVAPRWARRDRVAFGQLAWPDGASLWAHPASEHGLRVLPARAMRKTYRSTFMDVDGASPVLCEARADAAAERLNDANYDVFVATLDGRPAGRVGLLSVGDIQRIEDLFVLPVERRKGVGRAMLRHVLQLAFRLRPRIVVSSVDATSLDASARLLAEFNFHAAGRLAEWEAVD